MTPLGPTLLSLLVLLAACSAVPEERRGDPSPGHGSASASAHHGDDARGLPRSRFGNLDISTLEAVTFDINQDGLPDQTHYRSGGELVRIERDLNFDRRIDAWEHYQGGVLVEEEVDLDLDGAIDVVRTYQDGRVVTKRYAVGFRADLAVLRTYDAQGNLVRVERDTNRDGITDTWEHYQPGSPRPVRVETDTDGDGIPDRSAGPPAPPSHDDDDDGGDDDDEP